MPKAGFCHINPVVFQKATGKVSFARGDRPSVLVNRGSLLIESSSLDHALIFSEFPHNIDRLEQIIRSRSSLKLHFDVCLTRLSNHLVNSSSSEDSLAKQMGHFYRRFQNIRNQIKALLAFGPKEASSGSRLSEALGLLEQYEKCCRLIVSANVDMMALFDALWRVDLSNFKDCTKIYSPLYAVFDRCTTLERTAKQMEHNCKVRYNQAVFKVKFKSSKPGKPTILSVSQEQTSLSLFSRHIALLEIVFPKKKLLRRLNEGTWSYRLRCPLIPYSHVSLYSVPETPRSQFMVEMRLVHFDESKEILIFRCEDAKHKKDLIQQFRLLQNEACPSAIIEWYSRVICLGGKSGHNWIFESAVRKTKTDVEMHEGEEAKRYAQFSSGSLPSASATALNTRPAVNLVGHSTP